ncbi:MAG: Fic family protein [Clostridiales bacterium]|nr:Fic family protein [Clostridiales bacterium]
MRKDPFEEYIRQADPERRELGYAWYTAIGLQAVDGLSTSDYLKQAARENIEGKITLSQARELIESYYEESRGKDNKEMREADLVSARIATVLSERAFTFSVPHYIGIHKRLFEGIYSHAGKVRDYNISKKEWVLDGASVHYGSALDIYAMLEYDLQQEKKYDYSKESVSEMIPHLARFVADLWQIHAFGEGNTRTTAVFFIQYLRSMGFDVTNDIFAQNAWYFRNALVRANFSDLSKGVHETTEFLEAFLRNLFMFEHTELKNRYLHINWNSKKQDIGEKKQDIGKKKQDIDSFAMLHLPQGISKVSARHIQALFGEFGYEGVFGRSDVMKTLMLSASPASSLLKRMLDANLIVAVKGKGKGKYSFRNMI